MTEHVDIAVIGGGPAGSVAARGLSALGYRVCLITADRRPAAIEGLSARVIQAIRDLDVPTVDATLGPPVLREASWQGLRSEANQEWLVDRQRLDHAFRTAATAAGVDFAQARIGAVRRSPDGWIITTADGDQRRATYLIEARGRASAGKRVRGPSTTALSRPFRGLAPQARSGVASFRRGWAWFATMGDGAGVLQLAFASPLPKRPDIEAFWDEAIVDVEDARRWLDSAGPVGRLSVRHAETSRAVEVIEDGLIRIGDAALAIDPLAGHGVFEAVASASTAVPVVRTILERPVDAESAARFYRERIDYTFLRLARIGRDFYALEKRWQAEPFWEERRSWPDQELAHAKPGDPNQVPTIKVKPVVEDGFVVEREVIVTADHPRGVWQVDRVRIADLLKQLRKGAPARPEILAESLGRAPDEIKTALDWLSFRGLLDQDGGDVA